MPHLHWKTDYEGKSVDLMQVFREEEYKAFPVSLHDDMLDALARIEEPDLNLAWPMVMGNLVSGPAIGAGDSIFG